jgi:hypothetical protein
MSLAHHALHFVGVLRRWVRCFQPLRALRMWITPVIKRNDLHRRRPGRSGSI